MSLTFIDYTFAVILLAGALLGLARGLWLQLISVTVWALAAIIYYFEGTAIAMNVLTKYMALDVANWVVLAGLILLALCISFFAKMFASGVLGVNSTTWFNKGMGFMLGLIAALIVIVLIVYGVSKTEVANSSQWRNSLFIKSILPVAEKNKEVAENAKDFAANTEFS
jgi:uncharacterized membrane protein required for colicin V production